MQKFIVQHRRGTTNNWNELGESIIPKDGEIVVEHCADGNDKIKIGDGIHYFSELSYMSSDNYLVSQIASKFVSISLLAENWVGTESPYSQVVSVAGVTSMSRIDLCPSLLQLSALQQQDVALLTENNNGVITVYAIGNKPTNNYVIQSTITEVVSS